MQLLAAWLAALIAIEGIFLGGAHVITHPDWAAGLLVVSAVLTVPLFVASMFMLQTKFRPEIQDDEYYGAYLRTQQEVALGSDLLRRKLRDVGLGIEQISRGHSIEEIGLADQETITLLLAKLRRDVEAQASESPDSASAPAFFAIGKALMAEGRWAQAAEHFERASRLDEQNWEIHFALGYCHGKSRLGQVSDQAGLEAYGRALELAPDELEPNLRARLMIYHAALLKRLGHLDAAEVELRKAEPFATEAEEVQDLTYHLSSIYAITGRHDVAVQLVEALRGTPYLASVWSHLDDYYRDVKDDPRFLAAIESPDQQLNEADVLREVLRLRAAN